MTDSEREEGTNPAQVKTEEGQVCRQLSALLADASLRKALVRLMYHLHTESGKESSEQTAAECLEHLTQISFQQVPCVRIVQMKINKNTVSSRTKPLSFVHNKDGNPRQSVVYLDADACADTDGNVDMFFPKLVSAIQFVLGMNVEGLLVYRMLKSPNQADAILDEAGMKQCPFHKNAVHSVTPKVGSFVPLRHHHQLDPDFHEFCEGDSVAFEVYNFETVREDSEDNIPVYIYAIVLHEISNADTIFTKRYHIDLGLDRGQADVSLTRLYKITDKTDSSSGETQEQQTMSFKEKDDQTLNMSAVLKDLRQMLTKAWQVCKEEEFRCVTKRLILKWHPDIHSGKETACSRIIGTILHYAELLRQGKNLPEDDGTPSDTSDNVDGRVLGSGHLSSMMHVSPEGGFGGIMKRYPRHKSDHSSELNPQPGEGRRWLHTAQCDLTTARASRGICERGRNWVCFLCHQAVEKALKGMLYSRDADSDCLQSHSLPYLARQITDLPLQHLAQQMESRMGPHTRMRYPDVLVYPCIPADVYSEDDVSMACDVAWRVLDRVQYLMRVG